MTDDQPSWQHALSARDDLSQYGDNAIGLFALNLRFAIDDIHSVAAESVTDGSDDKKCDIIFIDRDEGVAIIAQCYCSAKNRSSAPANKAADLNTAIGWLLQRELHDLPERLQSAAGALRSAIVGGDIKRVEAWYVHNLPESTNVKDELSTVESTGRHLINALYSNSNVTLSALEVGLSTIEDMYQETLSPILVNEEVVIEIQAGFEIKNENWKAYVTAIPARNLYRLFKKHRTKLFSANVRDYLGSRQSDANINNGIKKTAETKPGDFWAFNNGITALTHEFSSETVKGKLQLRIKGISIVNGAQTTGAIGSLPKLPNPTALVPARFVETKNADLVYDIIQFNNLQNKVTASDFRSTDRIQRRLREEIGEIPSAKYEGGRRGGHRDLIARNKNLLPSYTVGQALAAVHQDPVAAYNQKSDIWIQDNLYSRFFNERTTGAHLVFCYALLRSVENSKKHLVARSKSDVGLTEQEQELLSYFRHRGSTYLFVSAVASCLETFLGKRIASTSRISFGNKVSPQQATQHWGDIVQTVSPFCQHLLDVLGDGLKSNERASKSISLFRTLVQATAGSNAETYRKFAKHVQTQK
ncbi:MULTISPECIES: AIPR family protein [Roseomonadaceae]|uniref:AIPR family protein n=1 Tax=Falsiroseomonas oleicola TaxID=2801474 RepID=A0ABS6HDT6_9PROT|nr:AIPR family protein [Roseomonas oleicola]MBU8545843.1 AIPR family protein [Roseomonas oleicola]